MSLPNILNLICKRHPLARAEAWGRSVVCSPQLLYAMLLLLPAIAAIVVFTLGARFLPVQGDNAWAEAHGVVLSERWARGIPLYSDFQVPPYIWTSFPPLWYALMAMIAKAGASNLDTLTLIGRMFTVVSLVGVGFISFFWNRRRGFTIVTSFSSFLFFASFPILIPWAVSARPDFPAIFLSFLSVYISASGIGVATAGVSAIVAALAFLMKHSAIGAPITIGICFLLLRRWRSLVAFSAVWIVIVGGTLVIFEIMTDGMLSHNLKGSHVGAFSLANIKQILVRLLVSPGQGTTLAIVTFGVFGSLCESQDAHTKFLRYYFLVTAALAIMASGLENAGENHFCEAAIVAAMFVPRALVEVQGLPRRITTALVLLLTFVLLLPSLALQGWRMLHEQPVDYRWLVPYVRGERIFTDIPYLAARSASLELLEPIALTHKERVHAWSSVGIVEGLNSNSYDIVILDRAVSDPRWEGGRNLFLSNQVRQAIAGNYRLCLEVQDAYIYGPKTLKSSSVGGLSCSPLIEPPVAKALVR